MLRVVLSRCGSSSTAITAAKRPNVASPLGRSNSYHNPRTWGFSVCRGLSSSSAGGGGGGRKGYKDQNKEYKPASSNTKKTNFDRDVLQRAQKGQLNTKHGSAIPRLAARKHKPHLTPVSGRAGHRGPPPTETPESLLDGGSRRGGDLVPGAAGRGGKGGGGRDSGGDDFGGFATSSELQDSARYLTEEYDPYFAFELFDDNKYYWREEEFEELVGDMDESIFFGEDGEDVFEIEYTKQDLAHRPLLDPTLAEDLEQLSREANAGGGTSGDLLDMADDNEDSSGDQYRRGRTERYDGMDPEEWFFHGSSDILQAPLRNDLPPDEDSFAPYPELRKEVVDLPKHHGSGVDGFLQAMHEHPTEYARYTLRKEHPATQREPKPDIPKNRQPHPPAEFVESHSRFLYVTGLPPLSLNGEDGDLDNPVHRSFLEKTVARLVNVDSTQVWPVNTTSAFVGFFTPRALAEALKAGPTERVLSKVPNVTLFSESEDTKNPFDDTKADRIVELTHLPFGHSPSSLLSTLFPPDTELQTAYGSSVDPSKDVYFLTTNKALIRFQSAEQASSAVTSRLWGERLADVGLYAVRYFRARRELVHAGFSGVAKDDEVRVMGPRLLVDGDMPSKKFFQSHPRCLHIRGLDPIATTPEMLTELFQPYCELPRQVASIERVVCEEGMPTDRAYVGFDLPGEAEACLKACNGQIKVGDRRLLLRLVKDRKVPHRPPYQAEKRPARSEEELWDDLNNWEKYVDPADIEYLQQHGVPKFVLDDALRRIRRSNPTFGPLDHALRSEALEPEKERGQLYKELVVMYIETLKECVATPEDPGELYEDIHLPDEPIDLSIFEEWERKMAEMEKSRSRPQ